MRVFKDTKGRVWDVTIDTNTAKRVRSMVNFDLFSVVEDESKTLLELRKDPVRMVDVLWAIVEPQAKNYGPWWRKVLRLPCGITDEEFGRSMREESLEQAWEQVFGALADFFPRGRRLVLLTAALQAQMVIHLDTETRRSLLGNELPATCGATSTRLRGLLALIRGRLPGANCR